MYDGIKIECTLGDRKRFSKALSLIGRFSEETGEVLPLPAEARYNSLTFSRIPGITQSRFLVQGSLHRFYNNGGQNDNDYTLTQVIETFKLLQQQYSIDPKQSKVLNFEFGVNIKLPVGMDAQAFNKYLVSANFKGFDKLNPRRPDVGYIAEFNEFSIKIYDKGYQARTGATDLIRVEIKVNRSRWLDQFGFIKGKELYLSDLINPDNVKILGNILLLKISSLILTPRQIDLKKLTKKQIQTFYECRDARSWEEWDSKKRTRKKEQLKAIFQRVNQTDPVEILSRLVALKWEEITRHDSIDLPEEKAAKNNRKKAAIYKPIVERINGILDLFKMALTIVEKEFRFYMYFPRGIPIITGQQRPKGKQLSVYLYIIRRIRGPP